MPCESWLDELRVIEDLQKSAANIEVYMPRAQWMGTEEYDPEKIKIGLEMGYLAKPINLIGKLI
jgi:hypothetical protein